MATVERIIDVTHGVILTQGAPRIPKGQPGAGRFAAYRQRLDTLVAGLIANMLQTIEDGADSIYPWLRSPWYTFDDTAYPRMERIAFGVISQDPLASVFEGGSGPAAGQPSYWPPFGEDSRLWEWVQRQAGADPGAVRSQNASARALLAARRAGPRDGQGRLTGTPLARQRRIAGTSAFPVARAIHDHGTPGRHEMSAFWETIMEIWESEFGAIIAQIQAGG